MNRRNFLRSVIGVAAATALPSEVFPFRKIFLPPAPKIVPADTITMRIVDINNAVMMEEVYVCYPEQAQMLSEMLTGLHSNLEGGEYTSSMRGISRSAIAAQMQIENVTNLQQEYYRQMAQEQRARIEKMAKILYTDGQVLQVGDEVYRLPTGGGWALSYTPSPNWADLPRAKYPGRLSTPLQVERRPLHKKATAENMMEFIDDLERSL